MADQSEESNLEEGDFTPSFTAGAGAGGAGGCSAGVHGDNTEIILFISYLQMQRVKLGYEKTQSVMSKKLCTLLKKRVQVQLIT